MKKITFLLFLFSGFLFAQPPNNDPSGAISLTLGAGSCSGVTAGDNSTATASEVADPSIPAPGCASYNGADIWYTVTVPASGNVSIETSDAGGLGDTGLAVYSGAIGSFVLVNCNDDASGLFSGLNLTGQTPSSILYVRVYGYNGATGAVNVCAWEPSPPPPPPSNNDCANATSLTVNSDTSCTTVTSGTIESATASGEDEATCGGTEDDDVWYSFVATSTSHNISLLNVAGSTTDLYHSVWSGTCGALTNLNCSDPNTSSVSGLTIGNTYLLRIYSWTATTGQDTTFDVCIGTPPAAPANNDCANATALTVNPDASCTAVTSGTIESATASGEDEATCGGTEDDDVWYSFVATSTSHDISLLNVAGSTTDLYHSVWSGTCGALTNLNCSDPNTSSVSGLTIGNTYLLRVYTWTGTAGQNTTFDVCIGTTPPPPGNDDLCNVVPLNIDVAGVSGAYTNQSATVETNEPAGACYTGGAQGTVWFSFVAPASGEVQISTDIGGTMTDSEIAVYDATGVTCADLSTLGTVLACDQDSGSVVGSGYMNVLDMTTANGNALTPGTTYYVQVSGYNDNRGTFGIQVFDQVTLGLEDIRLVEDFLFYPNPVNNVLNVKAKNSISVLQVINMLGQTVKTVQPYTTDYQLDFSGLTSGVYFVKAKVNNTEGTFRIVKK